MIVNIHDRFDKPQAYQIELDIYMYFGLTDKTKVGLGHHSNGT